MGPFFAELLLKSTILLLIPLGLRLIKNRTSADSRGKISVVVLIAVVFLPVIIVLGPDVVIFQTDFVAGSTELFSSASVSEADNTSSIDAAFPTGSKHDTTSRALGNFASMAFFSIAFLAISLLLFRYWKTTRLINDLVEVREADIRREFEALRLKLCPQRNIRLCWQESSASTWTWGVFKSTIGIPTDFAGWAHGKRKAALVHELFHIQQNDCISVLFARFVVAIYWWHPLTWVLLAQLRHDIECATDDRVLEHGIRANDYVRYLVEVARCDNSPSSMGIAMANGSGTLRGRIKALIETRQRRKTMSKASKLSALLIGFFAVSVLGSLTVVEASPTGVDREYIRLYSASPEYPQEAQEAGIEGYVDLEYDINSMGGTENIKVVNQVPESGVFEQAAIDAMRTFRYLPKIERGLPALEQGARMRIQFSLNMQGTETKPGDANSGDISATSTSIIRTNRDFRANLKRAALAADHDLDGERFLDLAEASYLTHPEMASYFLLRATQLGTDRGLKLASLKAMTLYELGDMKRSLALFTLIAENEDDSASAERWIARINYQIRRREQVYDELMSQRQ
ncbi:MAG: M56 family metallopeptidase [Gammaproteobacteria bacterium]|nr:M56 family metallopeptidase [Gammaproteobacteria bacterium]